MVLFTMPAFGARRVVLGEWYYPKNGNQWVLRGDQTIFEPGDTLIFKDDRVTIGRNNVIGSITYQLRDATADIVELSTAGATNEFVNAVAVGNGMVRGVVEGFAMAALILPDAPNGYVGANFVYLDNEKRGLGIHLVLESVEAPDLAQVQKKTTKNPATPNLSVTSASENVLANKTFTLRPTWTPFPTVASRPQPVPPLPLPHTPTLFKASWV